MGLSIWQVAVVVILFMLLFGRGRLPGLMSDLAEGIKSFRSSLKDDEDAGLGVDGEYRLEPQPVSEGSAAKHTRRASPQE